MIRFQAIDFNCPIHSFILMENTHTIIDFKSLPAIIAKALLQALFFTIILNLINFAVEFAGSSTTLVQIDATGGYITLDRMPIGFHIYSNVIIFIMVFFQELNRVSFKKKKYL